MKAQQQQQARELFLQSTLSRTQIADQLGVSRRTIYQWSVEGDWEKLRASARNMPCILAEKCYYLIGQYTDHLLQKERTEPVTKDEVNILSKLTGIVTRLKRGSTINENMETFTHFLESLKCIDPGLEEEVAPYANSFITNRASYDQSVNVMEGYTKDGYKPFSEEAMLEKLQDDELAATLLAEKQEAEAGRPVASAQATTENDAHSSTVTEGNTENEEGGTDNKTDQNRKMQPTSKHTLPPLPAGFATMDKKQQAKAIFWQNRAKAKMAHA